MANTLDSMYIATICPKGRTYEDYGKIRCYQTNGKRDNSRPYRWKWAVWMWRSNSNLHTQTKTRQSPSNRTSFMAQRPIGTYVWNGAFLHYFIVLTAAFLIFVVDGGFIVQPRLAIVVACKSEPATNTGVYRYPCELSLLFYSKYNSESVKTLWSQAWIAS